MLWSSGSHTNRAEASSMDIPLVSGKNFKAKTNCRNIMIAKRMKGYCPEIEATFGKTSAMAPFVSQRARVPKLCPFSRMPGGNISLKYTHITVPWEKQKNAMYAIRAHTNELGR